MGPAASVCSTANDMARWVQFVLNAGATADGDVIVEPHDMQRSINMCFVFSYFEYVNCISLGVIELQ